MTTELAESRKYTAEEVDRALLVMALAGGNAVEASRQLEAQGQHVPERTLRYWKNDLHGDRYQGITENEAKRLDDHLVAQQREVALAASSASLLAVEAARREIEAGTVKDPARAAQALQTTAGIASDKMLTLQGKPVNITQHIGTKELLNRIAQRIGGTLIVDATVVEDDETPSSTPSAAGQLMPQTAETNARELAGE